MSQEWTPADLPGLVVWVEGWRDMLRVVNGRHPPVAGMGHPGHGDCPCQPGQADFTYKDVAEVEKYLAKRWEA